jgi:hypothetical protein
VELGLGRVPAQESMMEPLGVTASAALSSSDGIRGMREPDMLIGARIAIGPDANRGPQCTLHVPTTAL